MSRTPDYHIRRRGGDQFDEHRNNQGFYEPRPDDPRCSRDASTASTPAHSQGHSQAQHGHNQGPGIPQHGEHHQQHQRQTDQWRGQYNPHPQSQDWRWQQQQHQQQQQQYSHQQYQQPGYHPWPAEMQYNLPHSQQQFDASQFQGYGPQPADQAERQQPQPSPKQIPQMPPPPPPPPSQGAAPSIEGGPVGLANPFRLAPTGQPGSTADLMSQFATLGKNQIQLSQRVHILTMDVLMNEDVEPAPTPEGYSLSGARMFENIAPDEAEQLIWIGRWEKKAGAVIIQFSNPENTTNFDPADVQWSLHSLLKAKGLSVDLIETDMPSSRGRTGPYTQTMAAVAAFELINDDLVTIFSSADEDVEPVEFTVKLMDQEGRVQLQKPRESRPTPEQVLEKRKEQKERCIAMYLDWPHMLKAKPKELQLGLQHVATQFLKSGLDKCEHVGFSEVKDIQGNVLPKMLVYARFPAGMPMEEVATALQRVKYVEMGLPVLAPVRIPTNWRKKLGDLKACCFRKECVEGVALPARDGMPLRKAPRCNAEQLALAARRGLGSRISKLEAKAEKITNQEAHKAVAEDKITQAARRKRGAGQECRAHLAGRCIKPPGECPELHNVSDAEIKCCSVLKEGDPHFNPKFRACRMARAGMECKYSHEPYADSPAPAPAALDGEMTTI